MTVATPHLLIIGCGDTGVRVAARAIGAGHRVSAVVRSAESAARARAVGAASFRLDLDHDTDDDQLAALVGAADRLLYSAPPPRAGEADTRLARVLGLAETPPADWVYIGTTGVYGDHGGAWVDEDTPAAPATDRAQRRLDAEQRLLAAVSRATILRAPGIYGPNRLPVDRVRAGEPVLADENGWTNRIHIDDLAAIAWRALTEQWPHRIYNVCDGVPTARTAYYDTLAELLGVAAPPRIDWAEARTRFSAMRLSFLSESRRLSNARLVTDTAYRFIFPDYRDGLLSSLRGETVTA
ncbi:SDR family oxidoreductase [Salinisphaera sp. Q1T1-3]|uniref:SDR family oxidoreductase n=1 Tax=Salinisphaera sp. Q1T1-3 TaxID=2321229 RepID=UPI000E719C5D|nr:SDR family oxidoreductase [Salinisphaera sp. Q1T1-3]RJS91389.1 SDR family oxidoreductase [Salinisphaera sp. Q1T1-3]